MSSLETSFDEKTQFIVGKILDINPEKESVRIKINQLQIEQQLKLSNLDSRIKETIALFEKLEKSCTTDLMNFKKIFVKFRLELDELNSFAKEGTDVTRKTGSD